MCCSVLLCCCKSSHHYYHYVSHYHWHSSMVSGIHNTVFLLSNLCQFPMSSHCHSMDSCSVHRLHSMLIHYIVFDLCNHYCCCCIQLNSIHHLLCSQHHYYNIDCVLYIVIVLYSCCHCCCTQLYSILQLPLNNCLHRYHYTSYAQYMLYMKLSLQMFHCMYQQSRCHNYNLFHSILYGMPYSYQNYNLWLSFHSFHYVLYLPMLGNTSYSL